MVGYCEYEYEYGRYGGMKVAVVGVWDGVDVAEGL